MKTILDCTMEVLTPCLCAGADQSVAEIRAPSIRGELRWWFRVLGGDKKEEAEIFGSAAGSSGAASNVVVRVSEHNSGANPKVALTSNQAFFTSIERSGTEAKVPAGSTFRLQLLKRRDFSSKCFDLALECFSRVGSLGLRANRGCGALQIKDWRPSEDQARKWLLQLKQYHFNVYVFEQKPRYLDTLSLLEEQMKQFRIKTDISEKDKDSLGYISEKDDKLRQSSCLKYRPVKLSDNTYLPVMLYTEAAIGDKTISRKDEIGQFFNQYAL